MPEETAPSPDAERLEALLSTLEGCLLADAADLRRHARKLRGRLARGQPIDRSLAKMERRAAESRARVARRRERLPAISYPDDLPVSQRRDDIAAAVREHPVVIVAGATGSGKTTQLPKICLELGRGLRGRIGVTQPRRIAAVSVADRVAKELETSLGGLVGYQIRFEQKQSDRTAVKFMTDGILLAESQRDRELLAYDTLVIDEAHERTLNIDFLLGILKSLLARRPELRVVVSSATLDVERFRRFFADAPVLEVEGRTYPVETRYRPPPPEEAGEPDLPVLVAEAVAELSAEDPAGDILAFFAGEQDIREAADQLAPRAGGGTEILPLFGRLSGREQRRVFQPGRQRRIILATNVAETSVTVPRIRFVIDTGLARVRRFNHQTQVDHLQIEPVSQASADQRQGRCGRLGPGVCIRLYGEEDYHARPRYTDPEIRRTSLASVILQMEVMGLGDVESFPFIDPPDSHAVRRGYAELYELGALDEERALTAVGRQMARLPVEPRYARMLLAAAENQALAELLVLTAALSIRDPRERPLEARQAADEAHARHHHESSDFLAWLQLWAFFQQARREQPSTNRLRRFCRENFLSYRRLLEWRNVRDQLAEEMAELGYEPNRQPATPEDIHQSLLAGLLSRVGHRRPEKRDYHGPHSTVFRIFPGSGLRGSRPAWIMAAELVKTRRLYARTVAAVEPRWIEELAGDLVKRSHEDPHWDARSGFVRAYEKVTLFGLPLVERRRVHYGPVDPEAARAIFIRDGLVAGNLPKRFDFLEHNQALVREVRDLENKARRTGLLVSQEALCAFYQAHLPAGIHNVKDLARWLHKAEARDPGVLRMRREDVQLEHPSGLTTDRFPETYDYGYGPLELTYRFLPGDAHDGVTCRLPVGLLPVVDGRRFEWLVPGLLGEKIAQLIRGLPKSRRRDFVPVPDTVEAALPAIDFGEGTLEDALTEALRRVRGVVVPPEAWQPAELPAFLRLNFDVIDEEGMVLASGRDLQALRRELHLQARETFRRASKEEWEESGLTDWSCGELPPRVDLSEKGAMVHGFPALQDDGEAASVRIFPDAQSAEAAHHRGVLRLCALALAGHLKGLARSLPLSQEALLYHSSLGGTQEGLRDDIVRQAIDEILLAGQPEIRDPETFRRRVEGKRGAVSKRVYDLAKAADLTLREAYRVAQELNRENLPDDARRDMKQQLRHFAYPGFVIETSPEHARHVPRYLEAMRVRLERLRHSPHKDRRKLGQVEPVWHQCLEEMDRQKRGGRLTPELIAYRWMIEEFRVLLFAQELGPVGPCSEKRLAEQWERVRATRPPEA